jgi:hypothetical protein
MITVGFPLTVLALSMASSIWAMSCPSAVMTFQPKEAKFSPIRSFPMTFLYGAVYLAGWL